MVGFMDNESVSVSMRITCSRCGATEDVNVDLLRTYSNPLSPTALAMAAERGRWVVVDRELVCPECWDRRYEWSVDENERTESPSTDNDVGNPVRDYCEYLEKVADGLHLSGYQRALFFAAKVSRDERIAAEKLMRSSIASVGGLRGNDIGNITFDEQMM